MTKKELIDSLMDPAKQIPDDAVIAALDGDSGELEAVTGLLYGPNRTGKFTGRFTVELCTDDNS